MRTVLLLTLIAWSTCILAQEGRWVLVDSQGSLSGEGQRRVFIFSPVERDGDIVRFWVKHESVSLADFASVPGRRSDPGPKETTKYMEADCRARTLAELLNAHLKGPAEFVAPGSVPAKMLASVCGAQ